MLDYLGKLHEFYMTFLVLGLLVSLPMLSWRFYSRRKPGKPRKGRIWFFVFFLSCLVGGALFMGDLDRYSAIVMFITGMVGYGAVVSMGPFSARARDCVIGFFVTMVVLTALGLYHLHFIYEPPRLPRINPANLVIDLVVPPQPDVKRVPR